MQLTLGDPETFQVIQASTWQTGTYKGYLICGSQFGYFMVQPGDLVLTFAGFIVYASSPQEAGILVDGHLAAQKKPRAAASAKKPARQSKTSVASSSSTRKKKKTPAAHQKSSPPSYFDRYYP